LATEHGIVLHNNSIRICFGPNGELFALPIYVINPPAKYAIGESANPIEANPGVAVEMLTVM
jgi:hypothetical protein